MTAEFSVFLREKRVRRGLSLGALAAKSGVSKATLSFWERGRNLPRLPEMDAVLNALTISDEEREQALTLLPVPRAVSRLREQAKKHAFLENFGPLPGCGELLRLLRLRQRWNLAQAAARLGVETSTLSRWESGKARPGPDALLRLCEVFQPHDNERILLQESRITGNEAAFVSLEELEHRFRTDLLPLELRAELSPARDVAFLRMEAALWPHVRRHLPARRLLAEVYAHHAGYLRNFRFGTAALLYARRAATIMEQENYYPISTAQVAIVLAERKVYGGGHFDPAEGRAILQEWLPFISDPFAASWVYRKIGGCLSLERRFDAALAVCEQAGADPPESEQSLFLQEEARRYKLETLLLAGRTHEAEQFFARVEDVYAPNRLRDALMQTEVLLNLGSRSEAAFWYQKAAAEVERYGLRHWQGDVDNLARRLE